ncbi:MAG: hypothetical protein NC918_02735 [Candidatus Omnitrophica bacterium]|nr:hypothetical protein [Candidatus Omnitrophota bacterium]
MSVEVGKDGIDRMLKEIKEKNVRLDESNTKSCIHEISETNKDVIKQYFRKRKVFLVNGFRDRSSNDNR